MKITLFILTLITSSIFAQNYVEGELIAKLKQETNNISKETFNRGSLKRLHQDVNVLEYRCIKPKNKVQDTFVIKFDSTEFTVEQAIKMYMGTGKFEYVHPNYIYKAGGRKDINPLPLVHRKISVTPNDPLYYLQWGLKNDGELEIDGVKAKLDADVDMDEAWEISTGDPDMIVAVIDSGVSSHPDLNGRFWENPNEIPGDGIDNDNNGYIDDVRGWNFMTQANDTEDKYGHGTNCGGIALATGGNNKMYAGVNWKSKIMVVKTLVAVEKPHPDLPPEWGVTVVEAEGTTEASVQGIYYAVDNGAKVITMSIGAKENAKALEEAVNYCYDNGVIFVTCMMNFNNETPYYPAAYDKTISVGATDCKDNRSQPFNWGAESGSNYGNHIDVVAPGSKVWGLYHLPENYEYDNSSFSGTSQAAPLVAGIISLMLDVNPDLTFEEIRTIIRETAEDQVGKPEEDVKGFDKYYGYGRVNAKRALLRSQLSLGVSDEIVKDDKKITIHPNPTANYIYIDTSEKINKVLIYNLLGQKVIETKSKKINLEKYQGVFLVKVLLDNGTEFTKEIVCK